MRENWQHFKRAYSAAPLHLGGSQKKKTCANEVATKAWPHSLHLDKTLIWNTSEIKKYIRGSVSLIIINDFFCKRHTNVALTRVGLLLLLAVAGSIWWRWLWFEDLLNKLNMATDGVLRTNALTEFPPSRFHFSKAKFSFDQMASL